MVGVAEKARVVEKWFKGNPQGPLSVHLDLTNRCNLRCRFCWIREESRRNTIAIDYTEMDEEKLLSIVREAYDLGVKEWLISGGGEPFMRRETCLRVMELIKQYGMHGDIITNGTLLEEKHLRRIVECGWDVFRVSVQAPSAQEHDYLVGKRGAYTRALSSLLHIHKLKKSTKQKKPETGFNSVISIKNYNKMEEMVELLHKVGCSIFNIQTIILYSERERRWTLNRKQRQEFLKKLKGAIELADAYGIRHNLRDYLEKRLVEYSVEKDKIHELGVKCFEPWYLITIRANGIVGSCRLFRDAGVSLKNRTLKDVWLGPYFNKNREKLRRGQLEYCSKCGANECAENRRISALVSKK